MAVESDLLVDYIHARARLAELQRYQWVQEAQTHYFMRDRLGLAAAVDRAAGVVRRLAHDLRLTG